MARLADMNEEELREYIKRIKRNAKKREKEISRKYLNSYGLYMDAIFGEIGFTKPYGDPRTKGPGYRPGMMWTRLVIRGRDGREYPRGKFELPDAYKLVDASNGKIVFLYGDPRKEK